MSVIPFDIYNGVGNPNALYGTLESYPPTGANLYNTLGINKSSLTGNTNLINTDVSYSYGLKPNVYLCNIKYSGLYRIRLSLSITGTGFSTSVDNIINFFFGNGTYSQNSSSVSNSLPFDISNNIFMNNSKNCLLSLNTIPYFNSTTAINNILQFFRLNHGNDNITTSSLTNNGFSVIEAIIYIAQPFNNEINLLSFNICGATSSIIGKGNFVLELLCAKKTITNTNDNKIPNTGNYTFLTNYQGINAEYLYTTVNTICEPGAYSYLSIEDKIFGNAKILSGFTNLISIRYKGIYRIRVTLNFKSSNSLSNIIKTSIFSFVKNDTNIPLNVITIPNSGIISLSYIYANNTNSITNTASYNFGNYNDNINLPCNFGDINNNRHFSVVEAILFLKPLENYSFRVTTPGDIGASISVTGNMFLEMLNYVP